MSQVPSKKIMYNTRSRAQLEQDLNQLLNDKAIINKLDNDCMLEIFKYLSVIDRVNASFTCKRWTLINKLSWCNLKDLKVNDKLFNEYLQCKVSIKKFQAFIINVIKNCGDNLNSVSVSSFLRIEKISIDINTIKILKSITRYCKNISQLTLIGSNYNYFDKILESLFLKNSQIRKIRFFNLYLFGTCFSNLQPKAIEEFLIIACRFHSTIYYYNFVSQLKNVRKIYIEDSYCTEALRELQKSNCESITDFRPGYYVPINEFSNLLLKQKNLKNLTLSKVDGNLLDNLHKENIEFANLTFDKSVAHYPVPEFPNLKFLISHIQLLTDEFMKWLSECKNLRQIRMGSSKMVLTKTGEKYFSQLKNLEIIYFSVDKNIDKILQNLSQCKKLKVLDISGNELTEIGFQNLISMANLSSLDISNTAVTDQHLVELLKKSLKLKELQVCDCENASNKFIEEISKIKDDSKSTKVLKIIYEKGFSYRKSKIIPEELKYISPLILLEEYNYVTRSFFGEEKNDDAFFSLDF